MLDTTQNDLLRGLTPAELALVLPELERRSYAAGEIILRRGAPGDCLFVIESGLVCVSVPDGGDGGVTAVVAQLGPGQIFGEMSILTGQQRSAEVRALMDTTVYALSTTAFFNLGGQSPTVLLNIGRVLAERLGHMLRTTTRRERRAVVVLVGSVPPLVGSVIATDLAAALASVSRRRAMLMDVPPPRAAPMAGREWSPGLEELRAGEETLLHLSDVRVGGLAMHAVNLPVASDAGWETGNAGLLSTGLPRLARAVEFIVVNLTGPFGPLAERALPIASRVYLVTTGARAGEREATAMARRCRELIDPAVPLGVIALSGDGATPRVVSEQVQNALNVERCEVLPSQAELLRDVARVRPPLTVHAPELAASHAMSRLAREVAGLRVGLALGGGAAKGLAHIGVVAALDRLRVPIDAIAGCSIGALIGGGMAMGMDLRQAEEAINRLLEMWGAALKPALPLGSLLSSGGLDRLLDKLAGDVLIEELPIPFGAVAADLNSGKTVYMRRGPLAGAIRASVSLPMIFPPVMIGDYALVDGGVTNLVPTHLARELGADVVLACHLSGHAEEMTPLELAAPPLRGPASKQKAPNIVQTYLRTIDIMRIGRAEHDTLGADLTFLPRLPPVGWKEFQRASTLTPIGEQAVDERLDELRNLLPWMQDAPP